jgi:hypothetical protein
MLSSEDTALLRSILDDICIELGSFENGTRAYVASMLLQAAATGNQTIDELKKAGREALQVALRR